MMTTSAGTIRPAVVVMGSGVGLQAIATAKRLVQSCTHLMLGNRLLSKLSL